MAFPSPPAPTNWLGWLFYVVAFLVAIWVVFQIVPAIATFISNLG